MSTPPSIHAQLLRVDGYGLSYHVGDIQTVSNIEAVPATRLFEAWLEQKFGGVERSFAVRTGLLDLNASFDSLAAPSLFFNSSHGIGADLARSGTNGPSIFPVTAPALQLSWLPSEDWTFRVAAFDGVPGDPDRPRAFAAVHIRDGDGALLIAQADYHLSDAAKVETGTWTYTRDCTLGAGLPSPHSRGWYASIESPFPGQGDLEHMGTHRYGSGTDRSFVFRHRAYRPGRPASPAQRYHRHRRRACHDQ